MTGRLLHGRWRWLAPTHLLLALAGFAFLASSCASWDGHLNILGYTTQPNYDMRFHSIFVQMFKNRTAYNLSTDVPGMEMDLTRAVVREIEAKTPYKVTSDRSTADTELIGTVVSRRKTVINTNQLGEVREGELTFGVEVTWADLRSGKILSSPGLDPLPTDRTIRPPAVLLMPQAVTREDLQAKSLWLAEECKRLDLRYGPRLHIELYGHQRGT